MDDIRTPRCSTHTHTHTHTHTQTEKPPFYMTIIQYHSDHTDQVRVEKCVTKCGNSINLGTFSRRTYSNKSANEVFLLYWFHLNNIKMEVTVCYDTVEQTYCPPLSSNSVGYHFSSKPCDCLIVIRHTRSHESYPSVRLYMLLRRLSLPVK